MGFLENQAKKEQEGPVPGETEHSSLEREREKYGSADSQEMDQPNKRPATGTAEPETTSTDQEEDPITTAELAAYERIEQLEGETASLEAENKALRMKVQNLNRRISKTKKVGNR